MLKTMLMPIARIAVLLALLGGSAPALAGVFSIAVDTSTLAGRSGWLDFTFAGLSNAAPASATITGFDGDTSGDTFLTGDVAGGLDTTLRIGNGSGWNEFAQWLELGGVLRFDIGFDVGAVGAGTTLSVTLLDEQFGYLPGTGDLVTFDLQAGTAPLVTADAAFATVSAVNAVPEPATLAQLVTGLLLMAGVMRLTRRR